ncbi:IS66 family insertion sequence hypothetical protein [Pandoraea terrae]|uniref:Transposase n=1 Tax=Pandoraea terrae TaxID=1537710 RepID=A0A5E4Z7C7_9BURK|nr:IS66 family insertion sequence hypothetical protein [Pandoraea terrae]
MSTELAVQRVRCAHSKQFQRVVVAECHAADESVSSVARKYGMNANIVHKWLGLAKAGRLEAATPSFIPIAAPVRAQSMPESRRNIELGLCPLPTYAVPRYKWRPRANIALTYLEMDVMAIPAHLWLKDDGGTDIKGSSTVQGREGSIEIIGFSHGLTLPVDGQSGIITGTRMHSPMSLEKEFDASSPYLYKAVATGQTLESAELR